MCLEKLHLQETTDRLRAKLKKETQIGSTQGPIVMPVHAEERAIRVALFSAEIDLAYHRARCSDCNSIPDQELIAA